MVHLILFYTEILSKHIIMGVFHDIYIYRYKCYKLWPTAVNVERRQIFSRLRLKDQNIWLCTNGLFYYYS